MLYARRWIEMRDQFVQHVFTPVPEEVHQKVLAALKMTKELRPVRRRFSAGIVAVVLFTLLVMGAAVASNQWSVLDYLFGGAQNADEVIKNRVWPVLQSQTALGVTATVDSALYDGKSISVGWVFENANPEEPVYFIMDTPMADDRTITTTSNDGLENTWLPDPFSFHINPDSVYKGGFTGIINGGAPDGKFSVSIRISVFKPVQPIYIIKDADFLNKWGQVDYNLMKPVIWEKSRQGYLVVREDGEVQLTLPNYEKSGEVFVGGSADEVESTGKFKREDMIFTFFLSNAED
jgi:hypothetical protein